MNRIKKDHSHATNLTNTKNYYAINISLAIILSGIIIPSNIVVNAVAESNFAITPVRLGTHYVREESGVVASRTYPGIFWMVSDSGNPARINAVDWSGATKRVFEVSGAINRDWEDIAIDGSGHLWIGDIGDNDRVYSSYVVYKINEPNPYGSATSTSTDAAYRFVYHNGARDAEALFIWQGTPYIVQKRSDTEVYAFPTLDASRTVTLKYVGKFADCQTITGADISADGRRLSLINDIYNYYWIIERGSSSTSIADFFTSPTKQWRLYFPNQQGEGIGFYGKGYGFVVAGEQGGFWKIDREMYDRTSDSSKTPASTSGKYTLAWGTYDYDNSGEATVLLNGREVETLPKTDTPSSSNTWVRAYLDISPYVINGENQLSFRQNFWSSGVRSLEIDGPAGVVFSDSTTHYQWDSGQKYLTYKFSVKS